MSQSNAPAPVAPAPINLALSSVCTAVMTSLFRPALDRDFFKGFSPYPLLLARILVYLIGVATPYKIDRKGLTVTALDSTHNILEISIYINKAK